MKEVRYFLFYRTFVFYGIFGLLPYFPGGSTELRAETDSNVTFAFSVPMFETGTVRLSSWIEKANATEDEFAPSPTTVDETPRNRSYPYSSRGFLWHDTARRRSIPVRIYYPAVRNGEKFPVIVFSHGLGGSIDCCSYLGTAWASRGFVVVMLQHPGSDENVWKGKIRILHELQEAYRHNWSGRTRATDIRFALDRLDDLARQGHWLASVMDLDRIGAGGYDLGSLAALLVAGQLPPDRGASLHDSRIKAVLAMSPPVNRTSVGFRETYASIAAPVFFVTGTEDDGIVGSTKAHQRRIPFDSIREADRYLITLRGADHRVYGGRVLSIRARNDKPFQALIVRTSSCFWRAKLRDDETAQTVLNGYGLNSMLGGMAFLERRFLPNDEMTDRAGSDETPVEFDVSPGVEDRQSRLPTNENIDTGFPLTRIYRSLAEKHAAPEAL